MIMERARCMGFHAGFPFQFWVDAIKIIVYLINKGPSSALDGGIPEEAWTSKQVKYLFLRNSGCEAFFHIDKDDNVPLLDTGLMILVIAYGILKIAK